MSICGVLTQQSLEQDRRGGHRNGQRSGTPLLCRQAERVGVVQAGEKSGETLVWPFST